MRDVRPKWQGGGGVAALGLASKFALGAALGGAEARGCDLRLPGGEKLLVSVEEVDPEIKFIGVA